MGNPQPSPKAQINVAMDAVHRLDVSGAKKNYFFALRYSQASVEKQQLEEEPYIYGLEPVGRGGKGINSPFSPPFGTNRCNNSPAEWTSPENGWR